MEPATMPPPQTRSNSSMPVRIRSCASGVTARSGTTVAGAEEVWEVRAGSFSSRCSSTKVSHSPQTGQRPTQRAEVAPQFWHT
jgi:hypothetical protein